MFETSCKPLPERKSFCTELSPGFGCPTRLAMTRMENRARRSLPWRLAERLRYTWLRASRTRRWLVFSSQRVPMRTPQTSRAALRSWKRHCGAVCVTCGSCWSTGRTSFWHASRGAAFRSLQTLPDHRGGTHSLGGHLLVVRRTAIPYTKKIPTRGTEIEKTLSVCLTIHHSNLTTPSWMNLLFSGSKVLVDCYH